MIILIPTTASCWSHHVFGEGCLSACASRKVC